jgi:hypothetical protein
MQCQTENGVEYSVQHILATRSFNEGPQSPMEYLSFEHALCLRPTRGYEYPKIN